MFRGLRMDCVPGGRHARRGHGVRRGLRLRPARRHRGERGGRRCQSSELAKARPVALRVNLRFDVISWKFMRAAVRWCSCRRSSRQRIRSCARALSLADRRCAVARAGSRSGVRVDPECPHARAGGCAALRTSMACARVPERRNFRRCLPSAFRTVEMYGLFRGASCGFTVPRCGWAGTRCTRACA